MRVLIFVGFAVASYLSGANTNAKVYRVGGDVRAPVRIKKCDPEFPESLKRTRITQPFFFYQTVISALGEVQSVRLAKRRHLSESDAEIDKALRRAIICWRFRPAMLHGKPVACHYLLTATVEVR